MAGVDLGYDTDGLWQGPVYLMGRVAAVSRFGRRTGAGAGDAGDAAGGTGR